MHRPAVGIARAPHFLGGEHQHRRHPADQRVEQGVEHGAIGAALGIARRVAIEAVLADIEEEGRQIVVAEVGERADVAVEVEIVDRAAAAAASSSASSDSM